MVGLLSSIFYVNLYFVIVCVCENRLIEMLLSGLSHDLDHFRPLFHRRRRHCYSCVDYRAECHDSRSPNAAGVVAAAVETYAHLVRWYQ